MVAAASLAKASGNTNSNNKDAKRCSYADVVPSGLQLLSLATHHDLGSRGAEIRHRVQDDSKACGLSFAGFALETSDPKPVLAGSLATKIL